VEFIGRFYREYTTTEKLCIRQLLASPFVHVDETQISIRGTQHYVWVFTDGKHVVFRMTETREATVVQEFLKGYQGVLMSDFYQGYDTVPCRQQKCWVHLIRVLNEDLWDNPFNAEFEAFVLDVRNLILPILEAASEYGLKKRNLGKFKKTVARFYDKAIYKRIYESDVTRTYQKRFERYRESLFLFLEHDNIPWNNNMAERAIRELAVQRKVAGSFFKRVAPQYLLLLGLAQTCRFQGKSFLKFLLARQRDVDAFQATKGRKSWVPVRRP
jgi:transposase-like protein